MEVILKEDVPNLGDMGDLVKVRPGYGRNYLIPRGLAVLATGGSKRQLEHVIRQIEERRNQLLAGAKEVGDQLEALSITIPRQAGDDERLFGSVTNRDIEAALEALGHTVDRRRIILKEPIKQLGIYPVQLKLHAEVAPTIRVWVVAL